MSYLIPNSFSSYELTEAEQIEGAILTTAQRELLQNDLAAAAEEKLSLEFDTSKPQEFVQQEAYKRGQIECMQYILSRSEQAVDLRSNPPEPEETE